MEENPRVIERSVPICASLIEKALTSTLGYLTLSRT
jgi:hypothetical protein